MTLTLRIQHRGGPYWAYLNKKNEDGNVTQTITLKDKGDEAEVTIWEGTSVTITESDPHKTDAYV